ncbi:MAG TPA: hypothetical protein VLH60_00710, partial [Sedimentisphaerales bacterium]|nr:hypothetical protein [Sedimentisphaerales bacterium]
MIERQEQALDNFKASVRHKAMGDLMELVHAGKLKFEEGAGWVNMHSHTFYSYNAYGYSPSKLAWLARRRGLAAAGAVDFDVLHGLEEFHEACRKVGLRGCTGIETRVFVPEFADKEMTSPGEPGITYHMGVGFPTAMLRGEQEKFLGSLAATSKARNAGLVGRVNKYLSPVQLDYDRDVLSLTPSGNATERHICLAYALKAKMHFQKEHDLENFWCEKLGVERKKLDLPDGPGLQAAIRSKTMKKGGVGYVKPDGGDFPTMAKMNEFVLAAGGVPCLTWLDGTSEGEQQIEKMLDVAMATGVEMVNIVPDRNYTAGKGTEDAKYRNLWQFIDIARRRDLPVIMGTEMNSPGQKFVDDFGAAELSPFLADALAGAYVVYGHFAMQRYA